MEDKEIIVISLGGSLVVPELPDGDFILNFKNLILRFVGKNKKFIIIVGGGKTCRNYDKALKIATNATNEDLDWMGIYSTHLNANFVRLSFGLEAYHNIITDPKEIKEAKENIIIGAGWKPGCSTDTDAVIVAKEVGAKKIINLSNVDRVYDSDPRVNKNAKPFDQISWKDYLSLIPLVWEPATNVPFDPVASKMAEENNIEVIFMSGKNLQNLDSYLSMDSFVGTTIK